MALRSTQPPTEMSSRSISWGGEGGRCVRLTTLPPSCAVIMKSGILNFLEPSGTVKACNGTALPLPLSWRLFRLWNFVYFRFTFFVTVDIYSRFLSRYLSEPLVCLSVCLSVCLYVCMYVRCSYIVMRFVPVTFRLSLRSIVLTSTKRRRCSTIMPLLCCLQNPVPLPTDPSNTGIIPPKLHCHPSTYVLYGWPIYLCSTNGVSLAPLPQATPISKNCNCND